MRIETERLVIRDFLKEDYKDAFEYLSDAVVMKYIEPIFTIPQTQEFIQNYGIKEKMVFAVEDKSLEKVVGHIIFHEFDMSLEYELGWIFNLKFHGRGYAKESGLAIFEYGFKKLYLESIIAETVLENKKSIATIESLGMKISKIQQNNLGIWRITRNDYKTVNKK